MSYASSAIRQIVTASTTIVTSNSNPAYVDMTLSSTLTSTAKAFEVTPVIRLWGSGMSTVSAFPATVTFNSTSSVRLTWNNTSGSVCSSGCSTYQIQVKIVEFF